MPPEPIAIIGVSAELPSAQENVNLDFNSFWPFLLQKGEAYSPIPQDRFNHDAFSSLITPQSGAFLAQPTLFDPVEFAIPSSDAPALPVSTRKLIEHAFLALRDAGINYRGADVGVYAAGVAHEPSMFGEADPHTLTGTFASIPATVANRISYHLDLHGPSLPLDTACSSTLVATHLAVQALRAGECQSAVVGGAQLNLRLNEWIQYSRSGVLSKDGKCKPFDASADGFARGEGVACIVLKPLDAALQDGDHIYATILGSAINSAGNQAPLNAPVAAAQKAAMLRAYERAGRSPEEVDFVEMHATGTAAGDPTEANWVGEMFRRKDGSPLLAGSVKGNVGHLEITAFLASLLKVMHMIEHHTIPPTANLTAPNEKIQWKEHNLLVPNTTPVLLTPRASSQKALVSLSSFGIGGANGHVIVEGLARSNTNRSRSYQRLSDPNGAVLIMSGGLSPRSSSAMTDLLRETFTNAPKESIPLLAKLAGRQSRQLTWRSYALYYPSAEPSKPLTFCDARLAPRTRPPLAFVFSGQGPQHALMGRQLFSKYAVFRRSVYECDEAYRAIMGFSLIESSGLFVGPTTSTSSASSNGSGSSEWTVVLPALTIFQIAVFDLLGSLGIKPDVVLGHSAGETALLYTSGAGPKEMAVQVAIARAKMMSVAESVGGGMAAVSCGEAEAQALIDEVVAKEGIFDLAAREQSLVLACYNSPDGVSVAGLVGLVDKLCSLAQKRGILARRLRIPVPVHSYLMDICKDQCETHVGDVFRRFPSAGKPKVTTYSTVTGTKWEELYSVDYFWRNARQAVLFNQVTSQLVQQYPNMCYIEISPHPVLSSYISSAGVDDSQITCPSRRPSKSGEFLEGAAFLESLGQLVMNGFDVNFDVLNDFPAWDSNVKLPPYPFNKKEIPFHLDSPAFHRLLAPRNGPLNHPRLRLSQKTHPLLAGHVINSEPIMPAAGFIEMALEFGAKTLSNVEFLAALPLSSDVPATVEVALDGAEWTVKTSSSLANSAEKAWIHRESPAFDRIHSRGILSMEIDESNSSPLNVAAIKSRCTQACRIEDLYDHGFKGFADYSAEFRRMTSCVRGDDELFAVLQGAAGLSECHKYILDPVVLDAVFHGCMFFIMQREQVILDYETRDYFLPSRVARVVLHETLVASGLPDHLAAHFVLRDWTPGGISVDISVTTLTGERLCTLSCFEMTRHSNSIQQPLTRRYQLEWQPVAIPVASSSDQCHVREITNNTRSLWTVLDCLAAQTIAKTLHGQIVVGVERHRQRYWEFAKKVEKRIESYPVPDSSLVSSLKDRYACYFDVTEKVSKVHSDIFTSSTATVQALYSNVEIMQNFYGSGNTVQPSCREAASLFRDLLQQLSSAGKKVIRVLEVGCGTGMLTEHLLNVVSEFTGIIVEYYASDISLGLALQASQRFSHPYIRGIAYDLTKSLEEQGIAPSSFDIVTALHVLHATGDLTQTLNSISDLLVPGGYTLVVDFDGEAWERGSPGTLWYDFIFGGFQEWFDFGEDRTSHCTVSLDRWRDILTSTGFKCNTFSCSDPDEDHSLVFLAQKTKSASKITPLVENGQATSDCSSDITQFSPVSDEKKLDSEQILEESCISDPIFTYEYGHEMDLRDKMARLDVSAKLSIWIAATDGLDGDSGRGLCRTLVKEFPAWTIRFVIFDASWSVPKRMASILEFQKNPPYDTEIKLTNSGEIYVPRIVPLTPPSDPRVDFDASRPWARIDGQIVHISPAVGERHHINVNVRHWSSSEENYPRAFLGTVACNSVSKFPKGSWVMGVTSAPLSNFLVVHGGSVTLSQAEQSRILADIPGIVTTSWALGPGTLTRLGRLEAINRVLVTDVHTSIGFSVARFCLVLGLNTFCIGEGDATELSQNLRIPINQISIASNAFWVAQQRGSYDVIISGSQSKAITQSLGRLRSPNGTVHMWNDNSQSLSLHLKNDWWSVTLALESAMAVLPKNYTSHSPCVHVDDIIRSANVSRVPEKSHLFDATKTYVLVGGIGGIGIQMALWMYENGARDIVLTSRRGRESLRHTGQIDSLRTLKYLEQLQDLSLHLEAVDASKHKATSRLLKSLRRPLGGCFLMSLVLSDKAFLNQTKEDFDRVFAAKTKAFLNLERCMDISRLDFFVTFSSVAALFGSAGQSNYTSASSAVESMTSKYPNAFSLVVPGIVDSGWLIRDQRTNESRSQHLLDWGLTTRELFDYLADGICKLRHESFQQYIPDLKWELVRQDMGSLTTFQHLCITEKVETAQHADGEDKFDLQSLVQTALNVLPEEFSPNVPFTSYGLDSLIAVRLSAAIRTATGLKVTQLQLLADMTLEDLEKRLDDMEPLDSSME